MSPDSAEDVFLHTSDGLRLSGLAHRSAEAPATVIVVHGFAASKTDNAVCALVTDLDAAGYNVLSYDARGHGESEGLCSVGTREHLDVASAIDHAAAWDSPVVLVGISMGAVAVVAHLADRSALTTGVVGAVLISAPARWRMRVSGVGLLTALLTRTIPGRWATARWLRVRVSRRWRVGEPPEDGVRRITIPLAIVHGRGDRILASLHGQKLEAAAAGVTRLELVEDMGHGIDEAGRRAAAGAVAWILAQALNVSRSKSSRQT